MTYEFLVSRCLEMNIQRYHCGVIVCDISATVLQPQHKAKVRYKLVVYKLVVYVELQNLITPLEIIHFCDEKLFIIIFIIGVFWTQDVVLYGQIVELDTQLYFVVEHHRLIFPELVKSCFKCFNTGCHYNFLWQRIPRLDHSD